VEETQKDLEDQLKDLEVEVDKELKKNVFTAHENDQDRDSIYTLAARLNSYIEGIESSLGKVVEDFNKTRGGTADSADDTDTSKMKPHEQIVRILNNHHDTLSWLEEQQREIAKDLAQITRNMSDR
jgi:hypothetical protein